MPDELELLKILIESSTPIVVMETVEEARAVRLIRAACSSLNLAAYEWSIAEGLIRCGSNEAYYDMIFQAAGPSNSSQGYFGTGHVAEDINVQALYNSREPAPALSNLEAISIEAAFILKDFHRHMEDPVVVRRLRDVGQKFSANRRTVIITGPAVVVPPELASLVEFLDLPLPDQTRLLQIIHESIVRVSKTHTLRRAIEPNGV